MCSMGLYISHHIQPVCVLDMYRDYYTDLNSFMFKLKLKTKNYYIQDEQFYNQWPLELLPKPKLVILRQCHNEEL